MAQAVDGLPGVTFDLGTDGHVVFAYCERCGQEFVPQTPMDPRNVWRAIRETEHSKPMGCKPIADFIALTEK